MSGSGRADLIEQWLEYSNGIPSPDNFRLWAAISAVAGLLERRVWIETARSVLYPNLFVLLVARPGVGKSQAISDVQKLWLETRTLKVAPDNVTKAALVDCIANASRKIVRGDGPLIEFNSLQIAASEFGVLVTSHDLEFLNTLNHIYDNPSMYRENRRGLTKQIAIPNPQINLIGGTQPAYLATLLPEEAWGLGFTSRIVMVYSTETTAISLFGKREDRSAIWKSLVDAGKELLKLHGPLDFDTAAQEAIQEWFNSGIQPAPDHAKLDNYQPRRIIHLLKLCMVAWASAGGTGQITLAQCLRAKEWLLSAEATMPDIFKDMAVSSDSSVIADLHHFLWSAWIKEKQKPIPQQRLYHFLSSKLPSEKVQKVLDIAERSNIIKQVGLGLYVPSPKHEHGKGL